MRYVIVSVVKGSAGTFNNNLRKEVFEKFKARSSKLPAHFTIKSPFESDDIKDLENILYNFCKAHKPESFKIKGYDHFDDRVIFMKVLMSNEGKLLHDKLIDELSKVSYINFNDKDGKDKIFHVTISSKKIQKIYNDLWQYVNLIPCDFDCSFDNISIYKWENNTWILHKEYILKNSLRLSDVSAKYFMSPTTLKSRSVAQVQLKEIIFIHKPDKYNFLLSKKNKVPLYQGL